MDRDNGIVREVTADAVDRDIVGGRSIYNSSALFALREGAILVGKRPLRSRRQVDNNHKWKGTFFLSPRGNARDSSFPISTSIVSEFGIRGDTNLRSF